ncbi:MAG: hypothetical protein ACOCYA_00230 [Spirochaetota bacterium]
MKKILIAVILIFAVIGAASAQNLSPIERDITALLEGLGEDIAPYLKQTALSGEGIGRASFGEGSRWFIAGSLGSTFTGGLLTFVEPTNSSFEALNVYNVITTAVGTDLLGTLQSFFMLPSLRLSFGIRLPLGIETIVQGSFIPAALVGALANAVGLPDTAFGTLNLGLRVRKVLMEDSGGFPAVSLGVGYNFANTHGSLAIPEVSQDIGGDWLLLSGDLVFNTHLHTVGLDLGISKKLSIFYPFFKVSPYYQWTTYTGNIESLNLGFYTNQDGTGEIVSTDSIDPAVVAIRDLSLLLSAGFELVLGKFIIMPAASFDVGTAKFHANLAFRLHF